MGDFSRALVSLLRTCAWIVLYAVDSGLEYSSFSNNWTEFVQSACALAFIFTHWVMIFPKARPLTPTSDRGTPCFSATLSRNYVIANFHHFSMRDHKIRE